ncbi:unnamed protein product, partial [Timema podura]|nr:unnamed protein product [Timema podura]
LQIPKNAKNILSKKSGYLVYTRGCHIPDLNPFDRHVKRFYHKESPINCSQNKPPNLVGSNLTALFIIRSALGFYNVSDVEKLQCCYQTFWRVNENKIKYSSDCQTFVKELHISEEFVKVKCSYEGLNIFTYYYAFTPLKKKVEERCQKKNIIPKEAVSLLVLGIDSVSRLNLYRQMPRTVALLKEIKATEISSVTHDYMNHAQQADQLCEDFIRSESNSYHFNKTVLVFLSDHGVRWGGIRQTFQGHLEERLPFLFFYFPKWFREKYSSALNNMRRNSRLLTTPFDLHETFKDLSNLRLIENDLIKKRSNELKTLATFPRGTSLFLPLDEGRTCSKAGIDPHWCTCLESHALATKSLKAQISAKVVIVHLNKLLKPYHACSSLRLSKILDASIKVPLLSQHKSHTIEDCVVVCHN